VIRATLDTNVLASGFAHPASVPGLLLGWWRLDTFELVLSEAILEELRRTLRRPYFADRMSVAEQESGLAGLAVAARKLTLQPFLAGVATHPEDDLILATAVQGHAHDLVTGDRQLQLLGSHAGVAIVSPRAFLDLLDAD
jgi:putative PIN family toxin of toxin-antitoxin system